MSASRWAWTRPLSWPAGTISPAAINAIVLEFGGSISAEHGIGRHEARIAAPREKPRRDGHDARASRRRSTRKASSIRASCSSAWIGIAGANPLDTPLALGECVMTIDRRSFLYAGGLTAAAAPLASAAHAAAGQGARSITDFGVEPNVDRDQTEAFKRRSTSWRRAAGIIPSGVSAGRRRISVSNAPSCRRVCTLVGRDRRGRPFSKPSDPAQRGLVSIVRHLFHAAARQQRRSPLLVESRRRACAAGLRLRRNRQEGDQPGPRIDAATYSVQFSGWEGSALFRKAQGWLVESVRSISAGRA